MTCKRIKVTGRVQGVGFRYFVKKQADALEIKGWVRNLYSGGVEMMVYGQESTLQDFIDQMLRGNGFSRVDTIDITPVQHSRFEHFEILASK